MVVHIVYGYIITQPQNFSGLYNDNIYFAYKSSIWGWVDRVHVFLLHLASAEAVQRLGVGII